MRTHDFLQRPPQMDPVVASNEAMLCFEGRSGCCGVYARVDLDTAGLEAERLGRGTTNVDCNMHNWCRTIRSTWYCSTSRCPGAAAAL